MQLQASPTPKPGHPTSALQYTDAATGSALTPTDSPQQQAPKITMADKAIRATNTLDVRFNGDPRAIAMVDHQLKLPSFEAMDRVGLTPGDRLNSIASSVKRPASGGSIGSAVDHPTQPLQKKLKVSDISLDMRQVIGFYKGDEALQVYAVKQFNGEVHVQSGDIDDIPLASRNRHRSLFTGSRHISIDLEDVTFNEEISHAYGDMDQKSKGQKLQLVKNYLHSMSTGGSLKGRSIPEPVSILASPLEFQVGEASASADLTDRNSKGNFPELSARVMTEKPHMPVRSLVVGYHKTDPTVPVLAKLRRESNPNSRVILFKVSDEEANASKFDFSSRAIHDGNLLKDVVFNPEFQRDTIQEIKAAIISHLSVNPRISITPKDNTPGIPTQHQSKSNTHESQQESIIAKDVEFDPKSTHIKSPIRGIPRDSTPPEINSCSTVVSPFETIVVASPSKMGSISGNNILGNTLIWLENTTIATKAAITYEKQVAAKEKNLDDEKSIWLKRREQEEHGLATTKQKLDEDKAKWQQYFKQQETDLAQRKSIVAKDEASITRDRQFLTMDKEAIDTQQKWIEAHLPSADINETLAEREVVFERRLADLLVRENIVNADVLSRRAKADLINEKGLLVTKRESEVQAWEGKTATRESLVKIRESEVLVREDNAKVLEKRCFDREVNVTEREKAAKMVEERLEKEQKLIEIKLRAIQREEDARVSTTPSQPLVLRSPPNSRQKSSVQLLDLPPNPIIKALKLENGNFEKSFKLIPAGEDNAGSYKSRRLYSVEGFVLDSVAVPKDYLCLRILQEPVFVGGTKQEGLVFGGGRSYLVYEDNGVLKYLDTKPEMVTHDGKIFLCWKMLKDSRF